MDIYCMHCFKKGIRNGSSIYRDTSISRKKWTAPEQYYVLSPSHRKHDTKLVDEPESNAGSSETEEAARTTIPVWVVRALICESLVQFFSSPLAKEFVSNARASLNGPEELKSTIDNLMVSKASIESKINLGLEELLRLDNSPLIRDNLRTELSRLEKSLNSLSFQIDETRVNISAYELRDEFLKSWDHLANLKSTTMIEDLLSAKFIRGRQFIDFVLISKTTIELHFKPGLIVISKLPKMITKDSTEHDIFIGGRYLSHRENRCNISIKDYVPQKTNGPDKASRTPVRKRNLST